MRYVLDTDVIIAAMRSPTGASAAILLTALNDSTLKLLCSVPLALEYEAKCTMEKHYEAAQLSREQSQIFVDTILGMMEPVKLDFRWRPQLKDPGDEMVLETAINGHADMLVTFNLRDYGSAPQLFGIQALRPADALKRIRQ
uniref:PIN domain-containing protein n=1 Tax=uncultured Thiotrichaceae bacterium TaxID=298394 RepID=A0A6S6SMC5_9GAMM|nr:MAG: Unknown protein [uncultured Thiotrichaceae bacterium]